MPVTDEIWRRAAAEPRRPAINDGVATRCYGDLTASADRLAAEIRRALGRGSAGAPSARPPRVAIAAADNAGFALPFLATLRAAAVACPIDPAWPAAERARVLAALRPRLVIDRDGLHPALAPDGDGDGDRHGDAGDAATGVPDADAAPFLIAFTAGSSGGAKGVQRSHASWLASLAVARAEMPLAVGARVLVCGPLVHSLSLFALVETLAAGATARLLRRFDAAAAVAVLADEGIDRAVAVPTMLQAIADAAGDMPSAGVGDVISGGAKLAPAAAARLAALFPRARVREYYGASELSFVSLADAAEGCPPTSVGRPMQGVEVEIRDDGGQALPPGATGLLWVRSQMLADGYAIGAGAYRRDAAGWATAGDVARRDAAGWITLAGRADGMIVSGGRNLYPAEVERVLLDCPAVAEAVALGLPDGHWGERLVAVIRWHAGRGLPLSTLQDHCRAHLAAYACPRQVFVVDDWPLTAAGKPALARLRAALITGGGGLRELAA